MKMREFLEPQATRNTLMRMAMYYQEVKKFVEMDIKVTSSDKLGQALGISAALIRKDLACFGGFGTKGVGYPTKKLHHWIGTVLGYDSNWNMALVGENLTYTRIRHYCEFVPPSFSLQAVFDLNEEQAGVLVPEIGMFIQCLSSAPEIIQKRNISLGVVAIGDSYVQTVTEALVDAGISAIGNLSAVPVVVPADVVLMQTNIMDGLIHLSYALHQGDMNDEKGRACVIIG